MTPWKCIYIVLFSCTVFALSSCTKSTDETGQVIFNELNNKATGASSNELLSAQKPVLLLEINYMPGFALQTSTLPNVTSFLANYTKKGSFEVIQKEIAASGKDSLSLSEISAIERKNRTAFNSANQVAVYILITDGTYNPTNTLGFAYRNTSMTLFGKTIKNSSGGVNQIPTSKLEISTLEHEFGHLLGLVNLGSTMQMNHADPANPRHCNNSKCLMYYQIGSTQFLGSLMNGAIPDIDANCHNDLIANGGK